jgi:hypothetical protein
MMQLRCPRVPQTHSGMLPQSRTLEAPAADNLRGVEKRAGARAARVAWPRGAGPVSPPVPVTRPVRAPLPGQGKEE